MLDDDEPDPDFFIRGPKTFSKDDCCKDDEDEEDDGGFDGDEAERIENGWFRVPTTRRSAILDDDNDMMVIVLVYGVSGDGFGV